MAACLQPLKLRWLAASAIAVGALAIGVAGLGASGGPSKQRMDAISNSVVKITCDKTAASGFIWPRAQNAVTAMHAVIDCKHLSAYYEKLRIQKDAKVVKVLKEADLSMVEINDPPDVPPLGLANQDPAYNDDLVVLGYPQGIPTMSDLRLRVTYGADKLASMLTDQLRESLAKGHIPSLDLRILRLEGHLQRGLSGAPILNAAGEVVAVGDGGLEEGAASIAWAVRTADVRKVPTSTDPVDDPSYKRSSELFSVEMSPATAAGEDTGQGEGQGQGQESGGAPIIRRNTVKCGELSFTKERTRSFQALAQSSDDLVGLQQLLALFQMTGSPGPVPGTPFDIYVNRTSGATIAVPPGAAFKSEANLCVAESGALQFYVFTANSAERAQQAIQSLLNDTRLDLQPDPALSYRDEITRFDGLGVLRAGYVGRADSLDKPGGYVFTTLLERNGVVVGVVGVNYALDIRIIQACQMTPADPTCAQAAASVAQWPYVLLGVYLSTFAIG